MTYVDLRPDDTRPVQVLHADGTWYAGELQAYRRDGEVWKGWVRYHVAIGAQHIGWFTEDRIRGGHPIDAV